MKWNKNENLENYGIIATSKVKSIKLSDNLKELDVYKIPLEQLKYNVHNGRIYMEIVDLQDSDVDIYNLEKTDIARFNDEIEDLIWTDDEEANKNTFENMRTFGQLEPGVVLNNGVVADGNRRFTCLRKLHKQYPDDEKFKYFNAAILFVDQDNISEKDIKRFELNIQFGQNEKVDYKPINFNMSIYHEIKENGWDIPEIARETGKKPSDITKIVRTCDLILEFLKYTKQDNNLIVASKLNIYWPLEPLGEYLNNSNKTGTLGDVEKEERKLLFFDYLAGLNIETQTQTLRKQLIGKIFSDNEIFASLNSKHEKEYRPLIKKQIYDISSNPEEFIKNSISFKNSPTANNIKMEYRHAFDKVSYKEQEDAPIQISEQIKDLIGQINVKPFIDSDVPAADEKLAVIRENLNSISEKVDELVKKISNKLDNNE